MRRSGDCGSRCRAPLRLALRLVLVASIAAPANAGETLRNGRHTVEFLGLERRTAADVHAQLRGAAAGAAAGEVHYCAADLIAKCGFAGASVFLHPQDDGSLYCVVTLLERERDAAGLLRHAPPASAPIEAPELDELARLLDRDEGARNAVHLFAARRRVIDAKALAAEMTELFGEPRTVAPAFALLDGLVDEAAFDQLLAVLGHAGASSRRRAAGAALANFAERDEAWHALVTACLDADPQLSSDAGSALQGLLRAGARRVDWKPAQGSIEALLAGAHLWALPTLIDLLVATEIEPAVARAAIAAQPRLLLDRAAARHAPTHAPARRLLALAVGRDHGGDIAAWREALAEIR